MPVEPSRKKMRLPLRRRVALMALALIGTLTLLEGTIQVGAYFVWAAVRQAIPEIPEGTDAVLCVGDSWGASGIRVGS